MGRFDFVEDDFDGFQKRDPKDHEHQFGSVTVNDDESETICLICRKTREQIREKW